ncbi:hypothetical protein C1645_818679 [Glomus cerebriforme]|uniref:Uncharacterized protein n=1 Tax=Glomus cerebriforme TaxID=658196 RepID=A0A397TCJ2_9GLOM|nr:hypothetical protein C1645_818679 [Glomus cerebriforme]
MDSNNAKFHISLISRRWYKENLQDDEQSIIKSDIITLECCLKNNTNISKQQFIIKLIKKTSYFPNNIKIIILKNENYQSHDVISVADDDKLLFKVDGRIFATQDIQKPLEYVTNGRPPNKRLKSAIETSKRSNKENKNDAKPL